MHFGKFSHKSKKISRKNDEQQGSEAKQENSIAKWFTKSLEIKKGESKCILESSIW